VLHGADRPNLVVDAEGKPLVVFSGEHGAGHNGEIQSRLGSISFTADRKVAETYSTSPNDRVRDKHGCRAARARGDARHSQPGYERSRRSVHRRRHDRASARPGNAAIEAAREFSGEIEEHEQLARGDQCQAESMTT
jgi:hypothetical protein